MMSVADLDLPGTAPVRGSIAEGFDGVARAFAENFTDRGEVGAGVHVTVGGESVVDLWGGTRDKEGNSWDGGTMAVAWSCTKGATALCAHLLADRGELDLDAPVAEYWPEFATNGKETATVSMMLDHSVGVAAFREPVRNGGFQDWEYTVERLAAEAPWWEPGTRNGYHMITFGWTVGELIRRVSGRSLGTFFREEIAEPQDADFWIGLPESEQDRVASVIAYRPTRDEPQSEFTKALLADRSGLQGCAWLNMGGYNANDVAYHRAEIGGGGGIGNARGLAAMYRAVANEGTLESTSLFSPSAVAAMARVSMRSHRDATLLVPTTFGPGFMLRMDNRRRPFGDRDSVLIGRGAFGHVGAGGSIGFADPEHAMSFGYLMNRMGPGLLLNDRGQRLVDAAYSAVGARVDQP